MQNEFKIVDGYVVTNKFLGQGAFGSVYRGYLESDPKVIVAVKILPLVEAHKIKNFMKSVKREIEILQKVDSVHIVKLLHAARTANNYYMFLEYCNGGDIKALLKSKGGVLSEEEAITYFKHIVLGFKAIYQENVIHRDIKPANIMLHNGIAKISDFGFARVVDDMDCVDRFTLLGTPLYMSPQILGQSKFSSKCDIWSLGMMFYEMLYGYTPWTANNQQSLLKQINTVPLVFKQQPKRQQIVKELIAKMLISDDDKRLNWYDLFEHELIKFNSQELKEKMNLIIDSVGDVLDQQAQLNQLYVNHNKVLAQGKNNEELFQIQEGTGTGENFSPADTGFSQESIKPGMTYNDIIDAQTRDLQEQDKVNNIDKTLTQIRNIGIFVNQATNNTFALYKDQQMAIPMHLFYRIIFILQKNQLIIFEDLSSKMASKIPVGHGFTDKDWKLYKKSPQYFTTLKAIKTDKHYIKPYYEEITRRTQNYLAGQFDKMNNEEKKEIEEFLSIMSMGLIKDIAFISVYEKVIMSVVKIMIESATPKHLENRLYLQTIKYLYLCKDPFLNFGEKQNTDFNKFYELYDNMELDQLWKEIQTDIPLK